MMEYKGYVATVEFDDSVGLVHGRVVNSGTIPSLLSRQPMWQGCVPSSAYPWTNTLVRVKKQESSPGRRSPASSIYGSDRTCIGAWRSQRSRAA